MKIYFYMGRSRFVTQISDSNAAENAAQEPVYINIQVKYIFMRWLFTDRGQHTRQLKKSEISKKLMYRDIVKSTCQ